MCVFYLFVDFDRTTVFSTFIFDDSKWYKMGVMAKMEVDYVRWIDWYDLKKKNSTMKSRKLGMKKFQTFRKSWSFETGLLLSPGLCFPRLGADRPSVGSHFIEPTIRDRAWYTPPVRRPLISKRLAFQPSWDEAVWISPLSDSLNLPISSLITNGSFASMVLVFS